MNYHAMWQLMFVFHFGERDRQTDRHRQTETQREWWGVGGG